MAGQEREPEEVKAKGKLKNYKLKHSRLLTCYSALLFLLAIYKRNKTVSKDDAVRMIALSPTGRIRWLLEQDDLKEAHPSIQTLLTQYEIFLDSTNAPEQELISRFMDKDTGKKLMQNANMLGDHVFEALNKIGSGDPFHRLIVV